MSLKDLMRYRRINKKARDDVDTSAMWSDRLWCDFCIMDYGNCMFLYKQNFVKRRTTAATKLFEQFFLMTPYHRHIARNIQGMSSTAHTLGNIMYGSDKNIIAEMVELTNVSIDMLPMDPTQAEQGISIIKKCSPAFLAMALIGIVIKTDNSNDVMPETVLNRFNAAWGGDNAESTEDKIDYVIRRQKVYIQELQDSLKVRLDKFTALACLACL